MGISGKDELDVRHWPSKNLYNFIHASTQVLRFRRLLPKALVPGAKKRHDKSWSLRIILNSAAVRSISRGLNSQSHGTSLPNGNTLLHRGEFACVELRDRDHHIR